MSCCDPKIDALLQAPATIKLIASVVMIDTDGRVLIAKRPEGKAMAGLWEFPGGKVEDGETPEATLVREIQEELGVKTCAGCLLPLAFASHRYESFHLLMPVYLCRQWEGIPQGAEGQETKWVQPKELNNHPMPKANQLLVSQIQDILGR